MLAEAIRDVWSARKPVVAAEVKDRLVKAGLVAATAAMILNAAGHRVGRWGQS